ncbi:hypothetical protein [Erythrobacter sp. WG]|uniref:hypothetical protein n=1 Tax=Erythrobacter sp. WG TaxID=2985510 RepID=UPI00226EEC86|nr:hypothetical protein [Erythrobacter sp. WG]MCX9148396.1 hypothetical protein [Erythrobacter sp. WG]
MTGAWANGMGYGPELLAIETLPDVFRTLGNVTADMAVMRLAGRRRAVAGEA